MQAVSCYVPKVVYHGTTFCFVGTLPEHIQNKLVDDAGKLKDEDKSELEALIGKPYQKVLMLKQDKVKYVKAAIRRNDTVGTFRKKLCVALQKQSPDDLYIWYKRDVSQDPVFVYHFIHHAFKKNKSIAFDRLLKAARCVGIKLSEGQYNMITREEATRMIFEAAPKKTPESLCFHYAFDGFKEYFPSDPNITVEFDIRELDTATPVTGYITTLLNTYDPIDDIFYVSDNENMPSYYFPFRSHGRQVLTKDDLKLLTTVDDLENKIESMDVKGGDIRSHTVLNVIHLKGNDIPGINAMVDLEYLFNVLTTSDIIPFIKLKTPSNAFYRIHKNALAKIPVSEYQKWTRVSASKDDKSFVVVKLVHHASYISLTFNTDLSFMVKMSLSIKDAQSHKDVANDIIPHLNKIITIAKDTYPNAFVPTIPKDILITSKDTDIVRVVHMITSTILHVKSSKLNLSYVPQVVKMHMYPYFNIINSSDSSVLHLQYKKVNNYTKLDNISGFITLNSKMERDDLISEVISTFMVSKEEAEREVEAWFATHAQQIEGIDKDKKKGNKRLFDTSNLVNIKIKLNSIIDLKYLTNGVSNLQMDADITSLIQKLMRLTEQHKKSQKKATIGDVLEKLEEQVKEPVPISEEESTSDIDEDDDVSSIMSGDDEDLLALQQEFAADTQKTTPDVAEAPPLEESSSKQGKSKVKGYILSKLYEADKGLFEYKPPPEVKRRDYASLCGWVDRRQPVVVSKEEIDRIQKEYPSAINGFVKSGSTSHHHQRNHYICPKIWCPKSRVAMSFEDYEKHGKKCPYPDVDEEPILFASKSYFGEGDAGLKKERYPGYLDKYIHPEHLCLPCCFKVKPSEGNRNKQRGDMCVLKDAVEEATAAADDNEVVKDKYIKGSNYSPLEPSRYGLLPLQLSEYLQQTNKQGNRYDGTGSITDQTDALLRRGISQTGQSYLDALVNILDNPEIRTTSALIDILVKRLDVLTYLSLENGRIMKMFMTSLSSIHDPKTFKEFYQWFKDQHKYLVQMSLQRLLKEIESSGEIAFSTTKLPHHHEILREFMIYQSFQTFKDYLKNERIVKEHLVLGDLVNNYLHKYVNINRYNILHLEYNVETDKIYLWCSINKDKTFNINYPFVFVMRRNAYYEPLVHVRQSQGDLEIAHTFMSKTMTTEMQKLVGFLMNNCIHHQPLNKPIDLIIDFCKSIGYKVKYVVIDYGYKVCGLVLLNNIYLPLENRQDFYFHSGVRYMYISDVVNLKCVLDQNTIKDVYNKIQKFTKSDFYNVKEFVDGGLMLKSNVYVPLVPPKDKVFAKNGLFILTGYEAMDKRRELTSAFEKEVSLLQAIAKGIHDRMRKDSEFAKQVAFLLDKHNPLPVSYRMQKLKHIARLEETTHGATLYKLMEYLRHSSRHYKLYMRRIQRFVVRDDELLLDHFDIQNGRLKEAIDVAENPHRAFLNIADELLEQQLSFDEIVIDEFVDVIEAGKLEDVPVKWRKILRGWKVVKNDDVYATKYMQKMFQRIHAKVKGHKASFTDELYELSYTHRITQAYNDNDVVELFENSWLAHHFKKNKRVQNIDNVLEAYSSIHYYPSIFDIKIMSNLAKVNLVLIGRKTTRNPDGLEVIKNSPSDMWVVLLFAFDRHHNHDTFSFFTHKGSIAFTTSELNEEFVTILSQKMTEYEVEVVDDRE